MSKVILSQNRLKPTVYVARKIYVHLEHLSFLREVKSVRRLFFPVVC